MGFFDKKNEEEDIEKIRELSGDIDFFKKNPTNKINEGSSGIGPISGLSTSDIEERFSLDNNSKNTEPVRVSDILTVMNLIGITLKKLPDKNVREIAKTSDYKMYTHLLRKYL